MKKIVSVALAVIVFGYGVSAAADPTVAGKQDVSTASFAAKLAELPLEKMEIEFDLTAQMCRVRDIRVTPSSVVCESPCSTGAGKYADIYPKDGLTYLMETGTEGADGTRTNHDGVRMAHFVRFGITEQNGKPCVVGMHAGNGEFVSRRPSTHGCVRLPVSIASALFQKVKGDKPGGSVGFKVPVRFTGVTPSVW